MPASTSRKSLSAAILRTGLLAGLLDGIAAIVQFYSNTGRGPAPVFRYIASGLFGNAAYTNGDRMIIAGIILHFVIAMLFTALFFLLYPVFRNSFQRWIISGILYGVCILAGYESCCNPLVFSRISDSASGTDHNRATHPY